MFQNEMIRFIVSEKPYQSSIGHYSKTYKIDIECIQRRKHNLLKILSTGKLSPWLFGPRQKQTGHF
jgi:hypothetical protein